MSDGWVKVWRRIDEWEWYQDANTFRLFIHCLIRANHAPKKWMGMTIKRGQFITSRAKLAEELGLGVQEIRTSLKRLKLTSNLTIKTTNRWTLITVEKYAHFQDWESKSNQQSNQQSNHQLTTNKNEKKEEGRKRAQKPKKMTKEERALTEEARENAMAKINSLEKKWRSKK